MYGGKVRVVDLKGEPKDLGRAHGTELSGHIRRYLADRLGLSADSVWSGQVVDRETVLHLAAGTLSHHEQYSEALHEEMLAMAEAAGITPAEAVVVGGFTDLIDLVRAYSGRAPTEDECTALIDPVNGVLAQTWDMHASAGEHVVLLRIEPREGPAALVQTTAGCLGQIGMNEAGISVGINNLTSMGRTGVTWPFVVRQVLQQTDLEAAVGCVLAAELAGGHNFLLMGPDGSGVNIEAMPGSVRVDRVSEEPYVHTNHCIDSETRKEEGRRTEEHVASSDRRLERARAMGGDLKGFFSDPDIVKPATEAHITATLGAVVMKPAERRFESVWGLPGRDPWESFDFD